ncbi:DNA-formamidopyrimidine glycosylase [Sesbania bispinosa]|nr:DNA-formamidopyrimidine glycosylase [Sesbania bispinosa]
MAYWCFIPPKFQVVLFPSNFLGLISLLGPPPHYSILLDQYIYVFTKGQKLP